MPCKNLGFARAQLVVREGKGGKDRITMLPAVALPDLQAQLEMTQRQYSLDRAADAAGVWLPFALSRKYPRAVTECCWQRVFPSTELSTDPESGIVRHHHLSDPAMQRAMKQAVVAAGIAKRAACHTTLRHCFTTNLLEAGTDGI